MYKFEDEYWFCSEIEDLGARTGQLHFSELLGNQKKLYIFRKCEKIMLNEIKISRGTLDKPYLFNHYFSFIF